MLLQQDEGPSRLIGWVFLNVRRASSSSSSSSSSRASSRTSRTSTRNRTLLGRRRSRRGRGFLAVGTTRDLLGGDASRRRRCFCSRKATPRAGTRSMRVLRVHVYIHVARGCRQKSAGGGDDANAGSACRGGFTLDVGVILKLG